MKKMCKEKRKLFFGSDNSHGWRRHLAICLAVVMLMTGMNTGVLSLVSASGMPVRAVRDSGADQNLGSNGDSIDDQDSQGSDGATEEDPAGGSDGSVKEDQGSSDVSDKADPSDGKNKSDASDSSDKAEKSDATDKDKKESAEKIVQSEHQLKTTLKSQDGTKYDITVTYDEKAKLPEDTKLSAVEVNIKPKNMDDPENKNRPYDSERFVTKKKNKKMTAELARGLDVKDKDHVFFTKFVDVSLTSGGKAVTPEKPVKVTITTDATEPGVSDALEVGVYDKKAVEINKKRAKEAKEKGEKKYKKEKIYNSEKIKNTTDVITDDTFGFDNDKVSQSENQNTETTVGSESPAEKKQSRFSFETKLFDGIGIMGVAKPIDTIKAKIDPEKASGAVNGKASEKDTVENTITVLGARSLKAKVNKESADQPEAGLEILSAFSASVREDKQPQHYTPIFWTRTESAQTTAKQSQDKSSADQKTSTNKESSEDSDAVKVEGQTETYKVKSGKLKKKMAKGEGDKNTAEFKAGETVAVIWDSGYRKLSLKADDVTLKGMMPEDAKAKVKDVADNYNDPEELLNNSSRVEGKSKIVDVKKTDQSIIPEDIPDIDESDLAAFDTEEIDKDKKSAGADSDSSVADSGNAARQNDADNAKAGGDLKDLLKEEITAEGIKDIPDNVSENAEEISASDNVRFESDGKQDQDAADDKSDANSSNSVSDKAKDNKAVILAAYDISISQGKDEYQPDKDHPVNVTMKCDEITDDQRIELWHIKDDGTVEIINDFDIDGKKISFKASGFSVYMVVGYTVDFHWGNTTYNLKGGSTIFLSELLENLVKESNDTDTDKFKSILKDMSQVKDVTFTDPKLLQIDQVQIIDEKPELTETDTTEKLTEKVHDDWRIVSLKSFTSNESLTITLKDGSVVKIPVTDEIWGDAADGSEPITTQAANRVTADGVTYTLGTDRYGAYAHVYAITAGCTIHDVIKYSGTEYRVRDIYQTEGNLTKRKSYIDTGLIIRAAEGYSFDLPDIKVEPETDPVSEDSSFVPGSNNTYMTTDDNGDPVEKPSESQIWKKAEYNPETNSIDYTMKYFQAMKQNVPIDFIFIYDDSASMYSGIRTTNNSNAGDRVRLREAQTTRVVILDAVNALLPKKGTSQKDDYDIKVYLGGASSGDNRRSTAFSTYDDVADYLATYNAGVTNHNTGVSNALALAKDSVKNGRNPIVIYLSDFHQAGTLSYKSSDVAQLHNIAQVYGLSTDYDYGVGRAAQDIPSGASYMHKMNDIKGGVEGLKNIIYEAIGYYMHNKVTITDNLSSALSDMDASNGSTEYIVKKPDGSTETKNDAGTTTGSTGKNTWTIGGSDSALGAATMYTETFSVKLDDETVYAGDMPTNGLATVTIGGKEVNRIEPKENDPNHLHTAKGVTFLLGKLDDHDEYTGQTENNGAPKSSNLIPGIGFTLREAAKSIVGNTYTAKSDATPYSYTTDNDGSFVVPYDDNNNNVILERGHYYLLTEDSDSVDAYNNEPGRNPLLKAPDKSWVVTVADNGVVTVQPQSGAGQTPEVSVASADGTNPARIVLWNKIQVPAKLIPITVSKTWPDSDHPHDAVPFTVFGVNPQTGEKTKLKAYDDNEAATAKEVKYIENPNDNNDVESSDDGLTWSRTVYVLDKVGEEPNAVKFFDAKSFTVDPEDTTKAYKIGNDYRTGQYLIDNNYAVEETENNNTVYRVYYDQHYSYDISEGQLSYDYGWYSPSYENTASNNYAESGDYINETTLRDTLIGQTYDNGTSASGGWETVDDENTSTSFTFVLNIRDNKYAGTDKEAFKTYFNTNNNYQLDDSAKREDFFKSMTYLEVVLADKVDKSDYDGDGTKESPTYYRIKIDPTPTTFTKESWYDGNLQYVNVKLPKNWNTSSYTAASSSYKMINTSQLYVQEVYCKFHKNDKGNKDFVIYSAGPGGDYTRSTYVADNCTWGPNSTRDHWVTAVYRNTTTIANYSVAELGNNPNTLEVYNYEPGVDPGYRPDGNSYAINRQPTITISNEWNNNPLFETKVNKDWKVDKNADGTAEDYETDTYNAKQDVTFSMKGTNESGATKAVDIFTPESDSDEDVDAMKTAWNTTGAGGSKNATIERTNSNKDQKEWTKTVYLPTYDMSTYHRTINDDGTETVSGPEVYTYTKNELSNSQKEVIATSLSENDLTVETDDDGQDVGEWADPEKAFDAGKEGVDPVDIPAGWNIYTPDSTVQYYFVMRMPGGGTMNNLRGIRFEFTSDGIHYRMTAEQPGTTGADWSGSSYYYFPFTIDSTFANPDRNITKYEFKTATWHTSDRVECYLATTYPRGANPVQLNLGYTHEKYSDGEHIPGVSATPATFTLTNTYTPYKEVKLNSTFKDPSDDKSSTEQLNKVLYTIKDENGEVVRTTDMKMENGTPEGGETIRKSYFQSDPNDQSTKKDYKSVYLPKGKYSIGQSYTLDTGDSAKMYALDGSLDAYVVKYQEAPKQSDVGSASVQDGPFYSTNASGKAAAVTIDSDRVVSFANTRKALPVQVKMDWEPGLKEDEDPLDASGKDVKYSVQYERSDQSVVPLTNGNYKKTVGTQSEDLTNTDFRMEKARQQNDHADKIPSYSVREMQTECSFNYKEGVGEDAQEKNYLEEALPDYDCNVVTTEKDGKMVFTVEAHIKRSAVIIEKSFDKDFDFDDYKGAELTYTIERSDGKPIYGTTDVGTSDDPLSDKALTVTMKVPEDADPGTMTGQFALQSESETKYRDKLDDKTKAVYSTEDTIYLPVLRSAVDVDKDGKPVKYILKEAVTLNGEKQSYFPTFTDQSNNKANKFEQTNPAGKNIDTTDQSPSFGKANTAKFILNPAGIIVGIGNAKTPYICKIVEKYGDGENAGTVENPFRTLNAALIFARANGNGQEMGPDNPVAIEMLVDYVIPGDSSQPVGTLNDKLNLNEANDNIIITTAETEGGTYNFTPTFTEEQGRSDDDSKEIAILQRGWDQDDDTEALFYLNNASAKLETGDIVLDGRSKVGTDTELAQKNGRAIYVNTGSLSADGKTTFRNFDMSGDGGAIYSKGNVTFKKGEIKDCTAISGGAIYMAANTKLNINGSENKKVKFTGNRATGTVETTVSNVVPLQDVKGGGAIFAADGVDITADYASFVDNAAFNSKTKEEDYSGEDKNRDGLGGAVCTLGSSLSISNSDIIGHRDNNYQIINAARGGAFYIAAGTLNVSNSSLSNCTVSHLEGTDDTGHYGGVVYNASSNVADNGYTITFTGCTIEGHTDDDMTEYENARDGGMAYIVNKGKMLVDNNSRIKGFNTYNKGGAIYIWKGDITVKDSSIYNCQAIDGTKPCGGAICNGSDISGSEGGALVLDHATISGNKAKLQGGAIYTKQNVTLKNGTVIGPAEIDGEKIEGNSLTENNATYAAGLFIVNGRTLILGGTETGDSDVETSRITKNTLANGNPSNVRLSEIVGGENAGKNSNSTVSTNNSVEINKRLGSDCLIKVINPKVLFWQFGEIKNDGLANMDCLKLGGTGAPDTNTAKNIIGDDGKLYARIDPKDENHKKVIWYGQIVCRIVDEKGNVLYRAGGDTVYGTLLEAFKAYKAGTAANDFKNRTDTSKHKDPDRIEMLVDVYEMTSQVPETEIQSYTTTLTTAPAASSDTKNPEQYRYQGEKTRSRITRSNTFPNDKTMIKVGNGADLTLKNIIFGGTETNHMAAEAVGAVLSLLSNSKATLDDKALIQYVDNNKNGGAIEVGGEATVTLQENAMITYCNAQNGGGIHGQGDGASVIMKGSSIVDHCKATGSGGGVLCQGTTEIQGNAKITNCEATSNGGGIFNDKSLTMKGSAQIDHCTAGDSGGGIGFKGTASIEENAKVTYCEAKNGGGVYEHEAGASVTMKDTLIVDHCTATSSGGGFFCKGTASIQNRASISNCKAQYGGGIRVESGSLEINGEKVKISDNKAVNEKEQQQVYGGAIYNKNGTVRLIKGEISNNKAQNKYKDGIDKVEANGGAICTSGGTATISGGKIYENLAESQVNNAFGGAIVIQDNSTVTITGGTINSNKAESVHDKIGNTTYGRDAMGGAIAVNKGTLNLEGGKIKNNTAIGYRNTMGGGISIQDANGKLNIKGTPVFGTENDGSDGNFVRNKNHGEDYSEKKNGGEDYPTPDGDTTQRSRQDIAIPALQNDNARIVVTGDIDSAEGSIWVWAPNNNYKDNKVAGYPENQQHYKFEQKFAKLGAGVSDENVKGLKAFRDAQDDNIAENNQAGLKEYLTGVLKENDAENVYWGFAVTGSRKVILRKVAKNTYDSLEGAKFKLYNKSGSAIAWPGLKDSSGEPIKTATELTSSASGVFYVGVMNYGTYYLEETAAPTKVDGAGTTAYNDNKDKWFCIIIDKNGLRMSGPKNDKQAAEADAKTQPSI